jgi:CBS domain containing-hemolysin-like protein
MTPTLILLIALLGCLAFFSASETAFTSLTLVQLKEIQRRHPGLGKRIERLFNRPELVITTILIGNSIVNIAIPVITTDLAIKAFGDTSLGLVTGLLTLIVLVFGEVTPKQMALRGNKFIMTWSIWPLQLLVWCFRPLSFLLTIISLILDKLTGVRQRDEVSVDSLLYLVKHAETHGVLDEHESRMVRSVFRSTDTAVKSLMTHRIQVFSLDFNLTVREALPQIMARGFSRIPVFDGNSENIKGVVLVKMLIKNLAAGQGELRLKHLMVEPVFVHENWSAQRVFAKLKNSHVHLAVVLDEYGGLSGIVTVIDLMTLIMGEMQDELNPENNQIQDYFRKLGDGTWRVSCERPLFELAELTATDLRDIETRSDITIAGFLEETVGRIPEVGEDIATGIGNFVIEESSHTRIVSALFIPDTPERG